MNGEMKVVVAGDFSPKLEPIQERLLSGQSGSILAGVRPVLASADLRLLQFEIVLTASRAGIVKDGPNLRAPAGCVDFVKQGGFEVALLANNHTGDFGEEALLETRACLRRNGILTVGAGEDPAAAAAPLVVERNGFRLAVLNRCEHEYGWAWGTHAGSAPLDMEALWEQVRQAREIADAVLVVLHGGHETNPFPSPGMVQRLHTIARMGASAVVNIHPHCPQGYEVFQGVPLVYSPGNFYFPAPGHTASWYCGYLPELTFSADGARLTVAPYRFDDGAIRLLEGGEKADFERYLEVLNAPLGAPEELEALFAAWASMSGPYRMRMIQEDRLPEGDDPAAWTDEVLARQTRMRNFLSCESHSELLSVYVRRFEQHQVLDQKRIARIEALREMKF